MLLEMGDYRSFARLNPEASFGHRLSQLASSGSMGDVIHYEERLADVSNLQFHSHQHQQHFPSRPETSAARSDGQTIRDPWVPGAKKPLWGQMENKADSPKYLRYYLRRIFPLFIFRPSRGSQESYPVPSAQLDELQLLAWNWKLLDSLARIHRGERLDDAKLLAARALREVRFGAEIGSTEVREYPLRLRHTLYMLTH